MCKQYQYGSRGPLNTNGQIPSLHSESVSRSTWKASTYRDAENRSVGNAIVAFVKGANEKNELFEKNTQTVIYDEQGKCLTISGTNWFGDELCQAAKVGVSHCANRTLYINIFNKKESVAIIDVLILFIFIRWHC